MLDDEETTTTDDTSSVDDTSTTDDSTTDDSTTDDSTTDDSTTDDSTTDDSTTDDSTTDDSTTDDSTTDDSTTDDTETITEPVTLAEAKAHLRILDTADDTYILILISSARQFAENYHNTVYAERTFTEYFDEADSIIELSKKPLTSVTSIKWTDTDAQEHDITSSFWLDKKKNRLIAKSDLNIDSEDLAVVNPVVVTYKAGTTPDASTKMAMLIMIAEWYENREDSVIGVGVYQLPLASKQLLEMRRHPLL